MRQEAIKNLEPGAFQAGFGSEDFGVFKNTIYQLGEENHVFKCLVLEEDMARYGITEREEILEQPAVPGADANQTFLKRYTMVNLRYEKQQKGLQQVKSLFLKLLDKTNTGKITQPDVGTLRISVFEALTILNMEYKNMTLRQLQTRKQELQAQRWDPSKDLPEFMEGIRADIAFLIERDYAPARGEQVQMLHDAVKHVTQFTAIATPAFHAAHPLPVDQTLARLITVYTTVYQGQFEKITASDHHAVNQVKADPYEDTLQGIVASARGSLTGVTLTYAQKKMIQAAVAKAIEDVLNSTAPKAANPRAPKAAQPRAPLAGACTNPAHNSTYNTHLEKDCRLNPQSANYTGQK